MKTILSWSSGKDSAWALHCLRQDPDYDVVGLLTTVNAAANRVAMHGVRRDILEAQADAAGLPLDIVELPWPCSNEAYASLMSGFIGEAAERGIEVIAFGDLFLEDIRAYRERQLEGIGLRPVFPLWGKPTAALAQEMVAAGLGARLSTVDGRKLEADFAGRAFDGALIRDLPPGVDPCGENGEFHTCVTAGPMFSRPLALSVGAREVRDGFIYADLLLDGD